MAALKIPDQIDHVRIAQVLMAALLLPLLALSADAYGAGRFITDSYASWRHLIDGTASTITSISWPILTRRLYLLFGDVSAFMWFNVSLFAVLIGSALFYARSVWQVAAVAITAGAVVLNDKAMFLLTYQLRDVTAGLLVLIIALHLSQDRSKTRTASLVVALSLAFYLYDLRSEYTVSVVLLLALALWDIKRWALRGLLVAGVSLGAWLHTVEASSFEEIYDQRNRYKVIGFIDTVYYLNRDGTSDFAESAMEEIRRITGADDATLRSQFSMGKAGTYWHNRAHMEQHTLMAETASSLQRLALMSIVRQPVKFLRYRLAIVRFTHSRANPHWSDGSHVLDQRFLDRLSDTRYREYVPFFGSQHFAAVRASPTVALGYSVIVAGSLVVLFLVTGMAVISREWVAAAAMLAGPVAIVGLNFAFSTHVLEKYYVILSPALIVGVALLGELCRQRLGRRLFGEPTHNP